MADSRGGGPPSPTPFAPFHVAAEHWPVLGSASRVSPSRGAQEGAAPDTTPDGVLPPVAAPEGPPGASPHAAAPEEAHLVVCPPDGGPATRSGPSAIGSPRSFAQVLLHSFKPPIAPFPPHPPACTDAGEPAAFFTLEEVGLSCKPLQTAIVARTPQGRPPFQEIRAHLLQRFKLQQDFVISSLDKRHLLIRFQNCDDFLQVLLKEAMLVQGRPFRFFRWSMDFSPDMDSPVVPVWLELPHLPANFFTEPMIRSIVGSIGPVLKIDKNTLNLASTQAARANVQMDVSKALPERIWIGYGAKGFWQPISYPDPPLYCSSCRRLGHLTANCRRAASAGPGQPPVNSVNGPGKGQVEKMMWRPVLSKAIAPGPQYRMDVPTAPSGNQPSPLSVKEAALGTAQQMFDILPDQPPLAELARGSTSEAKDGPLHPPHVILPLDGGPDHPPASTQGMLQEQQQHHATAAPNTAGPSLHSDISQVIDEMLQPARQSLEATVQQPRGTYYTSEPDKTDGSPMQMRIRTPHSRGHARAVRSTHCQADPAPVLGRDQLASSPLRVREMFDELLKEGGPATETAAATPPRARHPPFSEEDTAAMGALALTPAHAAPSAATQPHGAPVASKAKEISPTVLNAAAPPWSTPRSSEQPSHTHETELTTPNSKGAAPKGSPSGVETSPSPTAPRMSFAEAAMKKPRQRGARTKTAYFPLPPRPIVPAGGHDIGLPASHTARGAPVSASSSESEGDDLPVTRNTWTGRTRGTTTLNVDSDGDYEDDSEGECV